MSEEKNTDEYSAFGSVSIPPSKLSMALIRSSNLLKHEKELAPDEIADLLLNKKVLHLEYLRIGGCVQSLEPFSNLTEVYLQHNNIEEIGDGLELCTTMRLLCLGGNKLTSAEGLFSLNRLEVLDLSNNPIESYGKYGKNVFPPSITILDLSQTPGAGLEGHRKKAVETLSRLKILDGKNVTEDDGENRASNMYIVVPLDEDDGETAGEVVLKFQRDSDLWSVADTFCKVNDIKEELARRQLVVMMKKEARRVWGVTIPDGELTMRKMIETVNLTEDEDREVDYQKMGEERFEEVRETTMRAINAVESFMTELDGGEGLGSVEEEKEEDAKEEGKVADKFASKQTTVERMVQKSNERQEQDVQVSDAALKEAQENLARKFEIIKAEKLAQRRKDRETREKVMAMRANPPSFVPPPFPEETKEETKTAEVPMKKTKSPMKKNANVYGDEEEEENDYAGHSNRLRK